MRKYAEQFMDWLKEDGYTTCFLVGGGNILHLVEAASTRFNCVAVAHEVTAGIATEYFNESSENGERAFALVTAGPGVTNTITSIAGAFLESRELLVVAGQAKVEDLSHGWVRQIGHQEIPGIDITRQITVGQLFGNTRIPKHEVLALTSRSRRPRKGPVYIELCLDITAMPPLPESSRAVTNNLSFPNINVSDLDKLKLLIKSSSRPLILLGAGVNRKQQEVISKIQHIGIPIAVTWNAADRVGYEYQFFCGRPNNAGMRWSNAILQQADLILAIGTRLGIQQTGYNTRDFAPVGKVIQVDLDPSELTKGFPKLEMGIIAEANQFLGTLLEVLAGLDLEISDWQNYIKKMRTTFSGYDKANHASGEYIELYGYLEKLSQLISENSQIASCSSGGMYVGFMQTFVNKTGQKIISSKALASMGYGVAAALGMAMADSRRRTILFEGDGGLAQNVQDLGTISNRQLNVKIFVGDNSGYASIRSSQRTYFGGHYVGCDPATGLGLPNWKLLMEAYGIPCMNLDRNNCFSEEFEDAFSNDKPFAFVLKLDPEQQYFPKIASKMLTSGQMESNPIHLMEPQLASEDTDIFFPYLPPHLKSV